MPSDAIRHPSVIRPCPDEVEPAKPGDEADAYDPVVEAEHILRGAMP